MTRDFYDTNGQPLDGTPTNDPPESARIEWSPDYEAEYAAANEAARWRGERFYQLATPDYWHNITIAKEYNAIARRYRTCGYEKEAAQSDAIARAASEFVRRKRDEWNRQIEREWMVRDDN